jgi:hypothetical protein
VSRLITLISCVIVYDVDRLVVSDEGIVQHHALNLQRVANKQPRHARLCSVRKSASFKSLEHVFAEVHERGVYLFLASAVLSTGLSPYLHPQ